MNLHIICILKHHIDIKQHKKYLSDNQHLHKNINVSKTVALKKKVYTLYTGITSSV